MSTQPKIGQLVPLEAKAEQSEALREFLLTGYSLLSGDQEPETLQWYAVKYDTPTPTYAIIDSFAAESGRQAHIGGKVAEALLANSDKLLARSPDIPIGAFDILASKIRPLDAQSDVKKGLAIGLRVLLKAKEDQVEAVREFLQGALPLVEAEAQTPVWYAIEFPGTKVFGIIDFFATQEGLDLHLKGKVAEALFANVDRLLTGSPDIVKLEVLAVKI
ncbi:hypothetical protein OH76DRAFT_1407324 [Lentinus brumalis]|uniref:ABM domain-containing protein n=1 Tax=Lentinus brumalis TaxID=2498619 RepID=A0A371D0B8_9APHY|nr:hypothetical protein OH76DRAFT_1407324 [Polyporus brumalis]